MLLSITILRRFFIRLGPTSLDLRFLGTSDSSSRPEISRLPRSERWRVDSSSLDWSMERPRPETSRGWSPVSTSKSTEPTSLLPKSGSEAAGD
jgi:hypothetical protein